MRKKIPIKGVNYDIGVPPITGIEPTYEKMAEEIAIIRNELHCNAIRIYGRDLNKLMECSKIAVQEGLNVWFSPRLINSTPEECLVYIKKCSAAAEELRKISPGLVYVLGNEFSLDLTGFIKGQIIYERIKNLSGPFSVLKNGLGLGLNKELNFFLRKAVSAAREYFNGEITYASGQWEKIEWDSFDIISINYYRNRFNSWNYKRRIRKLAHKGKKLAVTEFGCCSYKGADKKGAWGYSIVDYNELKPKLKKNLQRDENVQAAYLLDLLNIYLHEDVYAAFIYTFISRRAFYNEDPAYDLDMANFGLIKVIHSDSETNSPYLRERKKSFDEVSRFYLGN